MLDRIESVINAPKKMTDATKTWERAFDEDLRRLKK